MAGSWARMKSMGAGDRNIPTIATIGSGVTTSITLPDDSNTFYITCLTTAGVASSTTLTTVYSTSIMEGRLVSFICPNLYGTVTFFDSGGTTTNGQMNLSNLSRDITGGGVITIRQIKDGTWVLHSFVYPGI